MHRLLEVESLIVLLVLVTTLVAIAVRRIRLPYTVALVLVGLSITVRRPLDVEATPELIMSLFVPPLIFEAAFHLDLRSLRDTLPPILILAIPGVLLTALCRRSRRCGNRTAICHNHCLRRTYRRHRPSRGGGAV